MEREFRFELGIASLLVGAIILAATAFAMIAGIIPSTGTPGAWFSIIGVGVAIVGLYLVVRYFMLEEVLALKVKTLAITNIYEVAVIVAILAVTAVLVYLRVLDAATFLGVVSAILGYLAKTAVDWIRAK